MRKSKKLDIYNFISNCPEGRTSEELSEGFKRRTWFRHIKTMQKNGIIKRIVECSNGQRGRPKTRYKIAPGIHLYFRIPFKDGEPGRWITRAYSGTKFVRKFPKEAHEAAQLQLTVGDLYGKRKKVWRQFLKERDLTRETFNQIKNGKTQLAILAEFKEYWKDEF